MIENGIEFTVKKDGTAVVVANGQKIGAVQSIHLILKSTDRIPTATLTTIIPAFTVETTYRGRDVVIEYKDWEPRVTYVDDGTPVNFLDEIDIHLNTEGMKVNFKENDLTRQSSDIDKV